MPGAACEVVFRVRYSVLEVVRITMLRAKYSALIRPPPTVRLIPENPQGNNVCLIGRIVKAYF